MSRLQFVHFNGVEKNFTREQAVEYINKLTNGELAVNIGESLIGEPMAVTYLDSNGNKQVLFTIGVEGEKGEGTLTKYHMIDSAKIEEDIAALSGGSEDIRQALEDEIARAIAAETALQNELDATQVGAGISDDGSYVKNVGANYIASANSLNNADVKLDTELARVEQARKDVTGQQTDVYVPNQSLISRPLKYIDEATDLNDADIKLDEGLQKLDSEAVKNIVVNSVSGVVTDGIAEVTIDAHDINIGEYEHYEGVATRPHPIHDNYTVLDAVKQLDLNFLDFTEKEELARKGIHIVKVTTGLDTNIKEAYDLVDKDGHVMENSDRILIYKDSSLYRVYLGHVDDRLEDYSRPDVISGTGDTALCFIYQLTSGEYNLVPINIEKFLEESEFLDGLTVNNHEVRVKIADDSENFLTVSMNGVKLSGVQDAIDDAVLAEQVRATSAENSISGAVTTLNENVQQLSSTTVAEINRLDSDILGEETRAIAKENELDSKIDALRSDFHSSAVTLDAKIDVETTRATTAEGSISGAVGNEVIRATSAETYISGIVTNEISRAQSAETTIATNLQSEVTARQNADANLNTNLQTEITRATGVEDNLRESISDETQRATDVEGQLHLAIENEVDDRQNAISDEITNREDADARLERMIIAAQGAISANTNAITAETQRAMSAETAISGSVNTLSGSVVTFSGRTVDAITDINERISQIDSKAIAGKDAINVLVSGNTSTVSLVLNGIDKVLDQDASGLRTTLSLSIANDGKTVYLRGKNDAIISQIDSSLFVKDGMLDTVTFDPDTKKLIFTFNNDAQKERIEVPLGELVSIYTVSGGSENYLNIADYKIGAKVDIANGLASYNSLSELRQDASWSARTINDALTTLSGATTGLSATTKTIERNLDALSSSTQLIEYKAENSASTLNTKINTLSAGTVDSINTLSSNTHNAITTEVSRATRREDELEELINSKANVQGKNSIFTERVGNTTVISLVFNPSDQVLTEDNDGLKTNLSLQYVRNDGKIYLKGKPEGSGNVTISSVDVTDFTNFRISALTAAEIAQLPESTNVKEAYKLLNSTGGTLGDIIKIYKDSSLYNAYLGHVDDRITSASNPTVIPGSGSEALCFIYYKSDGTYELVAVNVEDFLQENEFKDGLTANTTTHEVSVKIDDNSESFLTVSPTGVKLSGVQNAINAEKTRATNAENSISGSVDTLSAGTINDISDLSANTHTAITNLASSAATSADTLNTKIDNLATNAATSANTLNTAINNLATSAATSADTLNTAINTLSSNTHTAITNLASSAATSASTLNSKIDNLANSAATSADTLNNAITALTARVEALETAIANLGDTFYTMLKDALKGTTNEIGVTTNDTAKTITISFNNPYVVGEHNNDSEDDF